MNDTPLTVLEDFERAFASMKKDTEFRDTVLMGIRGCIKLLKEKCPEGVRIEFVANPEKEQAEAEVIRKYLPFGTALEMQSDGTWQLMGQQRWYSANNLQDVVALALEGGLNV